MQNDLQGLLVIFLGSLVITFGAAVWGGVRLADLLKMQGIPYHTLETEEGGRHVEFISVDYIKVQKFMKSSMLFVYNDFEISSKYSNFLDCTCDCILTGDT